MYLYFSCFPFSLSYGAWGVIQSHAHRNFLIPYGVILRMCCVSYIKDVNTIGTSFFCCIWFCTFDFALFGSHFYSLFLTWDRIAIFFIVLTSWVLSLKSTSLPRLGLMPERASVGLWGFCTAYFSEYTLSTLHSHEEFPGPCNKHVFFATVDALLVWPAFSVSRLLARPFSGLLGETVYPHFLFLTCLSRLASVLVVFYKVFPLRRPVQRLTRSWTLHRFPCRYSAQNLNIVRSRIACPIHWALRGGGSCWAPPYPFSCRRPILGRPADICWFPSTFP